MATRKLDRQEWHAYFDRVSEGLKGKQVEIEVAGLLLGDQIEAKWSALTGIVYDPDDDLIEVATDSVDHLVRRPNEVYVDDGPDGLHSVEIMDPDDNHHIIKMKTPLPLPAA